MKRRLVPGIVAQVFDDLVMVGIEGIGPVPFLRGQGQVMNNYPDFLAPGMLVAVHRIGEAVMCIEGEWKDRV